MHVSNQDMAGSSFHAKLKEREKKKCPKDKWVDQERERKE
jgi:hypothetical protein